MFNLQGKDKSPKHRAIFNAGARALKALGVNEDIYRCPICCEDYDDRAIAKDASPDYCLTLEHAPPASIGGKIVALTCKKCNNSLGSRLDSHVASREQFLRFIDPSRPAPTPFPAKLSIGNNAVKTVNIQLAGKIGSGVEIRAGKNNRPKNLFEISQTIQELRSADNSQSLTLNFPLYQERLSDLGFLKSAFLCLFAKFGYRYALSQGGRYIAQGILELQNTNVVKLTPFQGNERSILVSEARKVCFVGFSEFCLVCPWVNANVAEFIDACKSPNSFSGKYQGLIPFEMPRRLEAIYDNTMNTDT